MRVGVWYSNKGRDERVAEAFAAGCRTLGDEAIAEQSDDYSTPIGFDAAFVFGVKARERFQDIRAAGVHTIYFDKGYVRTSAPGGDKDPEFWRVAVNAHHPTRYLGSLRSPTDRWERLGIELKPWRSSGEHIIIAGSSLKYHAFNGLDHPTVYAEDIVRKIRKRSERPIIYRPKPSWTGAVPVAGASYSRHPERIQDLLHGAHALVTNGSNSCFEAVVAGIPCIVLGEAVASPISSITLKDIESPVLASENDRIQWCADLAYCQWTLSELASGEAWQHIRGLVDAE